jgi:non-canonical (house-cleaning) NTP pyrophosphatase
VADGQCPDFTVGLEGGLITEESRQVWCMAWMAIARVQKDRADSNDNLSWSFSKTGCFLLPKDIARLVLDENMELGSADDQVFSRTNSKHRGGTVGILTRERINRTQYYTHALHLALIPFFYSHLYFEKS